MSQNQKFSLLHWMIALTFGLVTTAATLGVLVMVLRMQADASVLAHGERELFRLQMQLDADGVLLKSQKNVADSLGSTFLSAPQMRWLGFMRFTEHGLEFDFGPGICFAKKADAPRSVSVFEEHRALECMLETGALSLQKDESLRFFLGDEPQEEIFRSIKKPQKKSVDFVFDGEHLAFLKNKDSKQKIFLKEHSGQWFEFSMQEYIEWQVAADLGTELKELQDLGQARALYRRVCRDFGCGPYRRILKYVLNVQQKKDAFGAENWRIKRSLPVGRRMLFLESKVGLWRQP